jgi:hypothetical protein
MKASVKKLWIRALRSGEFVQGHDQLRSGDGKHKTYCCLGVLEHLYRKEKGKVFTTKLSKFGFTSDEARNWAGLKEEFFAPVQERLAGMNDNDGKTFEEIADWIEANL